MPSDPHNALTLRFAKHQTTVSISRATLAHPISRYHRMTYCKKDNCNTGKQIYGDLYGYFNPFTSLLSDKTK